MTIEGLGKKFQDARIARGLTLDEAARGRARDIAGALLGVVQAHVGETREELDAAFLKGAEAAGLMALKGHRAVGGMRASLYNAMPIEGVQRLVQYMKEFEQKYG